MAKDKNASETTAQIFHETFDEMVASSGLPKAELAGQLLGLGVGLHMKYCGYLYTIKMLSSLTDNIANVAIQEELKKRF